MDYYEFLEKLKKKQEYYDKIGFSILVNEYDEIIKTFEKILKENKMIDLDTQ